MLPDLTTLDNVKGWLGLTDPSQTTDDALLARLITAASGFVRTWCSRDLSSQSYDEFRDGTGGRIMPLANTPITAVASVSIDGNSIPAGGIGLTGFRFTPTMLILDGYRFCRGLANVEINYTAGFASGAPELQTIEQAAIELIALRYKERDRIGLSSETLQGQVTAFQVKDVPPSVATILNQFKKVVPV